MESDRIEATRRAWEWWHCYRKIFTYLSKVVVSWCSSQSQAQQSSESSAKSSSSLKQQLNGLQETLELHLMERVNKYD